MTFDPVARDESEDAVVARGEAVLDAATAQLVSRAVRPPEGVSARIMERALATPRFATLVRAPSPHDHVQVSSLVVTEVLRAQVDEHVARVAVGRVRLDVTGDGALTALTIELHVQYGVDIIATADRVHALVRDVLRDVLGLLPGAPGPAVSLSHVHVSDVTVGDPRLVDPRDE